MIDPDLHVTIYVSANIVRMVCATVGFAIAVWGIVKMTSIMLGKKETRAEQHDVQS